MCLDKFEIHRTVYIWGLAPGIVLGKLEIARTVYIKMGAWDVLGLECSAVMTKISLLLVRVSVLSIGECS